MSDLPQEFLDALNRGDAIVCYARCWSCMLQQCPGGWHSWADDPGDWKKVVYLLGPDPRLQKCGCPCADGPSLGPEYDGPDFGTLNTTPCPICGAEGECANDSEGRPLIHALNDEDDS